MSLGPETTAWRSRVETLARMNDMHGASKYLDLYLLLDEYHTDTKPKKKESFLVDVNALLKPPT